MQSRCDLWTQEQMLQIVVTSGPLRHSAPFGGWWPGGQRAGKVHQALQGAKARALDDLATDSMGSRPGLA